MINLNSESKCQDLFLPQAYNAKKSRKCSLVEPCLSEVLAKDHQFGFLLRTIILALYNLIKLKQNLNLLYLFVVFDWHWFLFDEMPNSTGYRSLFSLQRAIYTTIKARLFNTEVHNDSFYRDFRVIYNSFWAMQSSKDQFAVKEDKKYIN